MTDASVGRTASDVLDIRPGMDVYSAAQDVYLGSVVRIWRRQNQGRTAEQRGATGSETGANPAAAADSPHLTHEEGVSTNPTHHVGAKQLGEEMGPFPTMAVGNSGPVRQSSEHRYATDQQAAHDTVLFAVRPGRINLGPLTPSFYVPVSAVRSVSMERVILEVSGNRIPVEWRRRPDR